MRLYLLLPGRAGRAGVGRSRPGCAPIPAAASHAPAAVLLVLVLVWDAVAVVLHLGETVPLRHHRRRHPVSEREALRVA